MTPVVEVRGAHKTFEVPGGAPWRPGRQVHAVAGVDLVVKPGEVVALVGQSGSGKTTLARMVLGLEPPTEGEIHLDGERWDHLSEGQRRGRRVRYQYIPQDALGALDPQQTVLEHVVETLRVLAGLSRSEARSAAREQLGELGLDHRAYALPRQLSGGEQRRVTLARVLALKPRLVVADEPTSGLDPLRREAVLEALVRNLPKDAACILVTHDMSVAVEVCDRAFTMLAGRVIEEVDPSRDVPLHPYAAVLFDPWSHPLPGEALAAGGCPYIHNCPLVDDALRPRCRTEVPALSPTGDGHRVACHAHEGD